MNINPRQLRKRLSTLIGSGQKIPSFIWGPPGIGKSAIVAVVAEEHELELVDLRLGQVAPVDLRGLPYVDAGRSSYARPEWLRAEGRGILFLDELPNAVPAVQGLSQQLLLDRRIGEHALGDGWFIIGAGNRREHGAAVHAMPSPVANRLIHFELEADLRSWKHYAVEKKLHPDIVGFVSFRPELLFRLERKTPAYPTPRSWEMASALHGLGLRIGSSVGDAVQAEFEAYCVSTSSLPDLDRILEGKGRELDFPGETSAQYAICVGLAMNASDEREALRAFEWIDSRAGPEWLQVFVVDVLHRLRSNGCFGAFAALVQAHPRLREFVSLAVREVLA